MTNNQEQDLPNKIHEYVTWPENRRIFNDGRGGLAFPSQNNSMCHGNDSGEVSALPGKPVNIDLHVGVADSADGVPFSDIVFSPSSSVLLDGGRIGLQITDFEYSPDSHDGTVHTVDAIPSAMVNIDTPAEFVPITADSLDRTTIVNARIYLDLWYGKMRTLTFQTQNIKYPFLINTNLTFALMVQLVDDVYVYLSHQDNPEENGVYHFKDGYYTKVSDEPVRSAAEGGEDAHEVLSDPTVNDNVECCEHFRVNYSHREVYDRMNKLVGNTIGFGVSSAAYRDCNGGLVDWFTNTGSINVGVGSDSVFVDGFGLGEFYKSADHVVEDEISLPTDAYDEHDGTLHPLIEWAYGTRYDAKTASDVTALPLDWPFTNLTSEQPIFNQLTDTSNITLVKHCTEGVGNLERDVDYEVIDPSTHSVTIQRRHVFNNKHHIVLYPDYTAINDQSFDYRTGSVVVKPLFVHLPASLDTKDGETVEITVSVQNVDPDTFGAADTKAALSGYYAAISQPRVYVMGGVQKFSNKKMHVISVITPTEQSYEITTDSPAYDSTKVSLLLLNTAVRANIVVSDKRKQGNIRTFTAHGIITVNTPSGAVIAFDEKFPYDIHSVQYSRLDFNICGMAYLDGGDNPSSTPMGLVGRDVSLLRDDMGTGSNGDLDEFNKFYSVMPTDGRTSLGQLDKRHVLATVYQSATSTFPWSLTNRRKMAMLDHVWTDECHRGSSSIMKMIYEQNADFVKVLRNDILNGYFAEGNDFSADIMPISYSTTRSWTSLGSVIRVAFPEAFDAAPKVLPSGNPVRQGQKAASMMMSDFRHMRLLSYTGNRKPRVNVQGVSTEWNSDWPVENSTIVSPTCTQPLSGTAWSDLLIQSVWCSNVRSLPDYVTHADIYDETSKYYIPNTHFFDTNWNEYVSGDEFPYNRNCVLTEDAELYSSACIDEDGTINGTVYGESSSGCTRYSRNSILEVLDRKNHLSDNFKYDKDFYMACRYAETVLAVEINDTRYMALYNLGAAYNDWMNPFTNIQSIDAVPVPTITDYDSLLSALDQAQHEYVSMDAAQMYRYETNDSDDPVDFLSTVMPTDSALGRMLESYVAAYGAKMPKHMYQGTRILLHNGVLDNHNLYLKSIKRVKSRYENTMESLSHYVTDSFAAISSTSRDSNVDAATIVKSVDGVTRHVPSIDAAASPYKEHTDFSNETYTRVIMEFTFSQKAGRWYTTGYRQFPTNYLSPLYGADAIGTTMPSMYDAHGNLTMTVENEELRPINGSYTRMPLWVNAACHGFNTYQDHMYCPYSVVPAMDMNLGCVPFMTGDFSKPVFAPCNDPTKDWVVGKLRPEYDVDHDAVTLSSLDLLNEPYKPMTPSGGGGLNLYPPATVTGGYKSETNSELHTNFWSVRQYIRPATSVLDGTDIPGVDDASDPSPQHTDGSISDPTLYRMFKFPVAGEVIYKLPDTVNPGVTT